MVVEQPLAVPDEAELWHRGLRIPVPSRAYSIDGLTFRYEAPVDSGVPLGGFVRLATDDEVYLGQVLSQEVTIREGPQLRFDAPDIAAQIPELSHTGVRGATVAARMRAVEGGGTLLGRVEGDALVPPSAGAAFDRAGIGAADTALVSMRAPAARSGEAELRVGTLAAHTTIPATLRAAGFNRHTFLCGQSGSGKTYALGVLLEQLVLHTRLRMLVLDPNGDYVHLGGTRPEVEADLAGRYRRAASDVQVSRALGEGPEALRVRIVELGPEGQAAMLRLDPLRDREEYNALLHLADETPREGWASYDAVLRTLAETGGPGADAVRLRLENLGIGRLAVLPASGQRSVVERWAAERPRALVTDLSGFGDRRERAAVTLALLHQAWERRHEREPVLIVVDEAHDLCPGEPIDELQALVAGMFVRIAGEGRKYGLHLLLATQRPAKLPPNVVSQCDNVVLLRVNSVADRLALRDLFSFVPPGLIDMAATFRQGQALLAGPITPFPLLAQFGGRLTTEGGSDVPTDWARQA